MRWLALCAGVGMTTGCSMLWGLDGLVGGQCGIACEEGGTPLVEGGSEAPVTMGGPDAAEAAIPLPDASMVPDGSVAVEAGRDSEVTIEAEAAPPPCTPPTPPLLDDCTGLLAMPAAPVIDGVLDCGVPLWTMPLAGWTGTAPIPSGVQTQIAAAYRGDGLYFFVHVTGAGALRYPPPMGVGQWCGDAVELFVDDDGKYAQAPSYDNPGTMQFIADAPPDSASTAKVGELFRDGNDNGSWTGQFVTVRTADGFDLEAFVTAGDLGLTTWSLVKSSHVGLDVSVDLGSPSGQPASCPVVGQYTIQVPQPGAACNQAACNVGEFCDPQLQ